MEKNDELSKNKDKKLKIEINREFTANFDCFRSLFNQLLYNVILFVGKIHLANKDI